jgi:hypothetical protein
VLNNKDKMVWIYLSKKVVLEKKSKGEHPRRGRRPRWEQKFRVVDT